MLGFFRGGVGVSGVMSQNSFSILAVTLTAITKLHPIDTSTSAGMLFTSPPSISAWPSRTIGTESTGRLMLSRIAWAASPRSRTTDVAAHQVDGDGQARDGELFEPPVVEVLAEHRVEVPAAVLVQQVPVVAARQAAEEPRRPQVGGELGGAVVAVEAGGVDDAGHRAGAGAGDHVHDDAVLLEGLEHAEVGHAAGGPAAEGHADAHAAEVVDQPFQAVGQRPAPGRAGAASRRS